MSCSLGSIKYLTSFFAINPKTKMSYSRELPLLWWSEGDLWFVLFISKPKVNSRVMNGVSLTAPKTEILHFFQGLAEQWLQFLLQFTPWSALTLTRVSWFWKCGIRIDPALTRSCLLYFWFTTFPTLLPSPPPHSSAPPSALWHQPPNCSLYRPAGLRHKSIWTMTGCLSSV